MEADEGRIYAIIHKKLTGGITDEEAAWLDKWLAVNQQNQKEFGDVADLWKRTGSFRFPGRPDVRSALSSVHEKIIGKQSRRLRLNFLGHIAAILLGAVFLSSLYLYFFTSVHSGNEYFEEVTAASGTRTHIGLPDGSDVMLNSGSSLRFSSQFNNRDERIVELKGEGFFKVARNKKKPFFVEAGKVWVKALGTAFNLNAVHADQKIFVALTEGKVLISADERNSGNRVILNPGQLARYETDKGAFTTTQVDDMDKYVGWTEGKLVFSDDPMLEVADRLENWFNVKIEIKNEELKNYRFTGTFINEQIEEILDAFSQTSPLKYEIIPASKGKNGAFLKRRVILEK